MPGSDELSTQHDSVEAELSRWIADMPDVDPPTEAARQRIGRMARLFERLLTEVAADNDLTAGDWAALSALQRSGPPYQASPTALSQLLGITSGTMSVRLARLSQAGLIESVAATDGRSKPVRLTAHGQDRWRTATHQRTDRERRLFAEALPPEALDELNTLLSHLLRRLEDEFGQATRHDVPKDA
ncbi:MULTISPECIES: MarR family winged helix-turn-helix transcriptional regulator [unclassified Streptomyces]|uniref:MarR family winged helix-turn-helix transcriptional regulator n=1 Tax=unclassified Streptomyces TaxID=2593676 RepID=UPI0027E237FB|nr:MULTISPECIES: MarR family winged helix-turn-helix transcriptional regulator [unclassified Streptomyces]